MTHPDAAVIAVRIADLNGVRERIEAVRGTIDRLTTDNGRLTRDLTESRLREALLRRQNGDLETERDDALANLDRLCDGADPTPVPDGVILTPAQAWHTLLAAPTEERLDRLTHMLNAAHDAHLCYASDHRGRLDDLRTQVARCTLDHQTADPWITRDPGGTLTLTWPPDAADQALLTRDALTTLVTELNTALTAARAHHDAHPHPDTTGTPSTG